MYFSAAKYLINAYVSNGTICYWNLCIPKFIKISQCFWMANDISISSLLIRSQWVRSFTSIGKFLYLVALKTTATSPIKNSYLLAKMPRYGNFVVKSSPKSPSSVGSWTGVCKYIENHWVLHMKEFLSL